MRILFSSLLVTLVMLSGPHAATAQSVSLADAISRMNDIIAEMEKLRAEFASLAGTVTPTQTATTAPAPAVLGAQTSAIFTQPLEFGETNDDIKRIQVLLATDTDIYPYGVASGFFGPKTEEAIKNLQARNGWDTPGVIGPATRDLLERYFKAYPSENWPADVLKSAPPSPQVLGVTTSNLDAGIAQQLADVMKELAEVQNTTPTQTGSGPSTAREINVDFDDGEALIEIVYTNGSRKGYITDETDRDDVIAFIVARTNLSDSTVRSVIDFSGRPSGSRADNDDDTDEEKADEALDDADDAIDDAEEEIEAADENGEDVDWAEDTLRDAKRKLDDAEEAYGSDDYDEAIELAEAAEDLAKDAEDRIGKERGSEQGDSEDIEEIFVEVDDGESEVVVEYENGDEYEFTIEEDDEEDIIEEIAEELDLTVRDVEKLIEFDWGDIDRIEVRIDDEDGEALARVFYDTGVERRFRYNETDENEIVSELADELDEDEEDIEDLTEFD